jgi:hypothetical protein
VSGCLEIQEPARLFRRLIPTTADKEVAVEFSETEICPASWLKAGYMKTGYTSVEVINPASSLDWALENASSSLNRAAMELGAGAVAVLLTAGPRVDVTYFWSARGDGSPLPRFSNAAQASFETLKAKSGFAEAGSPLAQVLREQISLDASSFLLFPWQIRQTAVIVVFCFAVPHPRYRDVPDSVKEKLDLIGLATWSVKEVVRLQMELRTVASRLAGRKLVERAKGVLQIDQGFTEERAYEYLRRLSRQRRITLAELAEEVVRERGGRHSSQLSATGSELAS